MTATTTKHEKLALLGGPKVEFTPDPTLFKWPIVTAEDEAVVIDVMRNAKWSGTDITRQFETEWAAYNNTKYALGHCNGTASLLAALYGCGVGRGDEVIGPSLTYWASGLQTFDLGATMVFADIDPVTLCIDPKDIEHRITPRTKAIMAVHYCGHPCDMDAILAIAKKHKLKVIEDVSHAQGSLYKNRICGSMGDVGGISMMGGKSFAIGEAGMLVTNDRLILDRAIALGHYERMHSDIVDPQLKALAGLPFGGYKFRMNQACSAMGRVQLKSYPARIKAIQDGMNRFWDNLEGVPGIRAHRTTKAGDTMGGWYNPLGHYVPEELGGLSIDKFCEAVRAEGGQLGRGANFPLHLHPVFNDADVYNDGKPTRIAFANRDVRQRAGSLPVSERLAGRCVGVPWFKHDRPDQIKFYSDAIKKVAYQAEKLL